MQATADPPVAPPDESMGADAGADAPRTARPDHADSTFEGPRWGVELAVMAAVLGAVAAVVYRVWDRAWSTPFVHAGDAMAHIALLDTVGWTGTPAPNDRLGAPYSVDWVDMPSGADRAHLIVLRGLRALTGDSVTAANVYLLLAIVMVGLAAYVVMRRLSCSPLASGVAAVVFAVAPAQFARASVGHLFLANYVAVPIAVYLALWASGALGPTRRDWQGWAAPVVLVLLVGSANPYYAVFGLIVIGSVGAVVALRHWSCKQLLRPAAVSVGIMAVVVANVIGEALRRGGDAGVRVPLDSDSYGLRITQMLLPIRDHRIGTLSEWADRAFRVDAPGDRGAALGALTLIGLVALGGWFIRRVGRPSAPAAPADLLGSALVGRAGVLSRLSVVALTSLGVATVGGLGMVLATVGVTQIRAWSRMAIFVGFVGAVVLAMLLDGLSRRFTPSVLVRVTGAAVLVLVAVFDQFGSSSLPPPSYNEQRWTADVELADDLQAALPDGAMVFQLPVGTFPAELPVGSISANDLLGPTVAGDGSLRWNVGALSGRSGDWQRSVAVLPVDQLLGDLAAADMAAVVIDRRGLDSDPAQLAQGELDPNEPDPADLETDVIEQLGPPEFVTSDGSRAWWDLRPLRARLIDQGSVAAVTARGSYATRPVGIVVEGSPGARSTGDARARHLGPTAVIVLRDPSAGAASPAPVRVSFTLDGASGSTVEVRAADRTRRIELGQDPVPVTLDVSFGADGTARVELLTDAPPLGAPASSWGDMRLRLDGLSVRDSRLER